MKCHYLIGGPLGANFKQFQGNKLIQVKNQMPTFRNFFPAVQMHYKLFVFGGYDGNFKNQIDLCEFYDFK